MIQTLEKNINKLEYRFTHGVSRSKPDIDMINHRLDQIERKGVK